MKFLLDEDLPPRTAQVARNLGLEAPSVHELDRRGLTDAEQLRFAAREGRVFVTRNRDDFLALAVEFYRAGEPHAGVTIVPGRLQNEQPERIAHALRRWETVRTELPGSFGPYVVDFL